MRVERIDNIISRTIEKIGLEQKIKEARLFENWKGLVGEQIAKHTQPVGIKRKKLFVNVDNPTWVFQLTTHHKKELLDKLNRETAGIVINDIYFKIGSLDK